MSEYYTPKRVRNLFDPQSKEPFKLSRTKIENFTNCPRCFYIDVRLGTGQPGGFPFTLNNAVDNLLKKEFDIYRAEKSKHPLMKEYKIDAVPFSHEKIEDWRNTKKGITYLHQPTNLLICGGVDDVWINSKGGLHIVDYKATSKTSEITIDEEWQMGYKRQIEVYQWLFRKNGFKVSDVGYFVYCNGNTDKKAFDKKIEFDIKIIPYEGNDAWVENAINEIHKCLVSDAIPGLKEGCDFCDYVKITRDYE